jgi:hypothetical protein
MPLIACPCCSSCQGRHVRHRIAQGRAVLCWRRSRNERHVHLKRAIKLPPSRAQICNPSRPRETECRRDGIRRRSGIRLSRSTRLRCSFSEHSPGDHFGILCSKQMWSDPGSVSGIQWVRQISDGDSAYKYHYVARSKHDDAFERKRDRWCPSHSTIVRNFTAV